MCLSEQTRLLLLRGSKDTGVTLEEEEEVEEGVVWRNLGKATRERDGGRVGREESRRERERERDNGGREQRETSGGGVSGGWVFSNPPERRAACAVATATPSEG